MKIYGQPPLQGEFKTFLQRIYPCLKHSKMLKEALADDKSPESIAEHLLQTDGEFKGELEELLQHIFTYYEGDLLEDHMNELKFEHEYGEQ